MTNIKQFLFSIKNLLLFFVLILLLSLISLKKEYSLAVTSGLILYVNCILPTLLPYLFIIGIINSFNLTGCFDKYFNKFSGKIFNTSGKIISCFLISFISGFPVGSKLISDLKNKKLISDSEAIRASAFCSSPSPAFLISTVGGSFLHNRKIGLVLLLSSFLSALSIGIIFSFYKRQDKPLFIETPYPKNNFSLYDNTYNSVISILVIGAMITVFYLFGYIIVSLNLLYPFTCLINLIANNQTISNGIAVGLIEITSGIQIISTAKTTLTSVLSISFLCGFLGLSGILQSLTFLKSAKIKTTVFLISKIISAVLNLFFTYFIYLFLF